MAIAGDSGGDSPGRQRALWYYICVCFVGFIGSDELLTIPARAHLVLSEELLAEIDRVAGKRRRSSFVEAAVREKLARETLSAALQESAGSLDLASYPEWKTPDVASEWVRSTRREDNRRLPRKRPVQRDRWRTTSSTPMRSSTTW